MAVAKNLQKSKPVKLKSRNKWTKDDFELTLLGLPAFVWFIVFSYLPMFGALIAFKNFRVYPGGFLESIIKSDWVGFDNFKFFFAMKDLLPLTGYLRGGCSPIGMKKAFPTFVQEDASQLTRISVSAGVRGCQVILAVDALCACTRAGFAALCREA